MVSKLRFVLFVVLLAMVAFTGMAEDIPEVMIVLDGSGSMGQGVDTYTTRMDAAKEVLKTVIPQLPVEVKVGLAAYGHREKQNCEDIEILIPPGNTDRETLLSKALAIEPVGNTPISLAIQTVADALAGRSAETTIILVSDGAETCGGDPCAVVKALKAAGVNFIMHVVGFDVNDTVKAQLSCMAQEGGGKYFGATDTASLLAALSSVKQDLEVKVEKAKTRKVKKSTGLGKMHLTFPESAKRALSGLKITRKSDGKVIKEAELSSSDSMHPLMSGEYQLSLMFSNPNYKPPTEVQLMDFTVNGGEVAEIALGAIGYNMADGLEDNNIDAVVILHAGTGEEALRTVYEGNGYYFFKAKALPAGTYNVGILYKNCTTPLVIATDVAVESGKESLVTVDTGIVLDKPEVGGITGWDLIPSGETAPLLEVRRSSSNNEPLWRRFIVPAGTYDIHIHIEGMGEALPAGQGVEVEQGQLLSFETGL